MLIEKYGNAVLKERRRDWAERYIKIVVMDHNLNEEKVFTKQIDGEVMKKILNDMKNYKGYYDFTGLDDYDLSPL